MDSVAGGSVGLVSSCWFPVFSFGFSGSVGFVCSVASVASVGLVTSEAWVEPVISGGSVCGTFVSGGAVVSVAPVVSIAAGDDAGGDSCTAQPKRLSNRTATRVKLRIFFM